MLTIRPCTYAIAYDSPPKTHIITREARLEFLLATWKIKEGR